MSTNTVNVKSVRLLYVMMKKGLTRPMIAAGDKVREVFHDRQQEAQSEEHPCHHCGRHLSRPLNHNDNTHCHGRQPSEGEGDDVRPDQDHVLTSEDAIFSVTEMNKSWRKYTHVCGKSRVTQCCFTSHPNHLMWVSYSFISSFTNLTANAKKTDVYPLRNVY